MKKSFLVLLSVIFSGCSSLLGDVRPSLEDQTYYDAGTVGGQWPEGSQLSDGDYHTGNYFNDGSSPESSYNERDRTWISEEHRKNDMREGYRQGMSYGQNPNVPPSVKRAYQSKKRATKEDFIDRSQNEASLWASTGQTNYFFTKNRIRSVGDIVTVSIEEGLIGDIANEVKRTLNQEEVEAELEDAQARIERQALESAGGGKKKGDETIEEIDVPDASYADIDIKEKIGVKPGEIMMAEILERYPNGNYKIRAVKRVPYRGTVRNVTMMAIAQSKEVEEGDIVKSGKLYEYRLKAFK